MKYNKSCLSCPFWNECEQKGKPCNDKPAVQNLSGIDRMTEEQWRMFAATVE